MNVMADVAMYYWIHDLRPGLADKVQQGTAPWQNVTLYGLSIGAEGTLSFPTAIDQILAGAPWPTPANLRPEATDDLWHATLNGHGQYYNVQNRAAACGSDRQRGGRFHQEPGRHRDVRGDCLALS